MSVISNVINVKKPSHGKTNYCYIFRLIWRKNHSNVNNVTKGGRGRKNGNNICRTTTRQKNRFNVTYVRLNLVLNKDCTAICGHMRKKQFPCGICERRFKTFSYAQKHMQKRKADLVCNVCSKKFCLRVDLDEHLKTHEGVKSYKCDICGKEFVESLYYKCHMKIHTGDYQFKFQCDQCPRQFPLQTRVCISLSLSHR